jgi:hypothetical protein
VSKEPKTVKFGLRADRGLGGAGAPCQGYYHLVEYTSDDKTAQINHPSMFDVIKRALGEVPPHGSKFEIEVTVRVVHEAPPSKKDCHNPWPSHRCR